MTSITLSPSQQKAVEEFRGFLTDDSQHEFLISGFAGSGKSFLVEYLIQAVMREHQVARMIDPKATMPRFYFTATTNKAAHVLSEMLGQPTMTAHKMLGLTLQTDYKTGNQRLVRKQEPKNLTNSIVFVDEASMITYELLNFIREGAKQYENCKIVYIGDSYQLPPVKETLCPIFLSNLPVNFLTEIQRQVAGSPIIQLSTKYREMLDDHTLDWPKLSSDGHTIFHYTDKDKWFDTIKQSFIQPHHADDLRVLAWTNQRIREYNRWIRSLLGHTDDFNYREIVQTNKPIINSVGRIMAATDSMHQILGVRDHEDDGIEGYSISLQKISNSAHQSIDVSHHNNFSVFQPKNWKEANDLARGYAKNKKFRQFYRIKEQWADLRPIHAQTVHKAQGSTYRDVFIDLTNIGKNNKWQEVARLVYVAVTRASHQIHLFGHLPDRYNKKPIINPMEVFRNAAQS